MTIGSRWRTAIFDYANNSANDDTLRAPIAATFSFRNVDRGSISCPMHMHRARERSADEPKACRSIQATVLSRIYYTRWRSVHIIQYKTHKCHRYTYAVVNKSNPRHFYRPLALIFRCLHQCCLCKSTSAFKYYDINVLYSNICWSWRMIAHRYFMSLKVSSVIKFETRIEKHAIIS